MKISSNPPQHLSNYEVLQHFLSLKRDNDALRAAAATHADRDVLRAREQLPLSAFEKGRERELGRETPDVPDASPAQLDAEDRAARRGVADQLVWVQDEVIRYLCADFNVTARQTADGVAAVADQLQDYNLTKAELLQACNLAPMSQVGLYLIIEEAETRLAQPYEDTMEDIIHNVIAPSVLPEVPKNLRPFVSTVQATDIAQTIREDAAYEEEYPDEEEFVHEVEWGAGREGAVDDEEDNTMD